MSDGLPEPPPQRRDVRRSLADARRTLEDRVQRVPAGLRYMAAAAFFFSVMSVLVKIATQTLPSSHAVMARGVVTFVISLHAIRRAGLSPWGNDRPRLLLRGIAGFVGLNCFYHSLATLTLADASVIQYLNPVFAALLAVVFLGERMRPRDVVAIVASFVGVVLVAQPPMLFAGSSHAPLGDAAIAVAGAVASGIAYVTVRRLRATDAPEVIVFYFPLLAVPLSVGPLLRDLTLPSPREWLVLLGIGVATQIAQVFMTRGLHAETAGRATAMSYLQVPFAYVWGIFVFGEVPNALGLAGTALIGASVLALTLGPPGQGPKPPMPAPSSRSDAS